MDDKEIKKIKEIRHDSDLENIKISDKKTTTINLSEYEALVYQAHKFNEIKSNHDAKKSYSENIYNNTNILKNERNELPDYFKVESAQKNNGSKKYACNVIFYYK